MNDRIHQLAEKAKELTRNDQSYIEASWLIFEKKFAELLIQDVEQIVDDLYMSVPLEQQVILLSVIEKIKRHFG